MFLFAFMVLAAFILLYNLGGCGQISGLFLTQLGVFLRQNKTM